MIQNLQTSTSSNKKKITKKNTEIVLVNCNEIEMYDLITYSPYHIRCFWVPTGILKALGV